MQIFKYAAGAAFTLGMLIAAPAGAAVVHDEDTAGDLSDSGLAPDTLDFSLGDNEVRGTTGSVDDVIDRDYFTFTVDAGQELTAILVLPGTTSLVTRSFIGLEAGGEVTVSPDAADATGLLGWWHYTPEDVGTDILDNISIPVAGASGFDTPLGAGTYSVWIQEANVGTSSYAFSFVLSEAGTPVPEPAAWPLMLIGASALGWGLRKKGRHA